MKKKLTRTRFDLVEPFNFGYPTEKPCEICGELPAEIEPRFGYSSCEEHSKLSPIEFQKLKEKNENSSK
jgi:hypothetical protein